MANQASIAPNGGASVRNYQDIKTLASQTGKRIPDLLAMASQNDPFYIMPAQEKQAQWFADLWTRLEIPHGAHLRRIHYKLISQPFPVLIVDGRPYENTERCWQYLGAASKAARCLSLVSPDAFQDQRNPDPTLNRDYLNNPQPYLSFDWQHYADEWLLPSIHADLADDLDWSIPEFNARGYSPSAHDQPFHIELISEKSTMDDVVIPLCKSLGVNYAPATGFQSITGAIDLLKRLRQAIKADANEFDPVLPDRYASPLKLPDAFPGLFDSQRGYLEQLPFYKARHDSNTEVAS